MRNLTDHTIATVDDETLLGVVIDRLKCFQGGHHARKANADALAVIRVGLKFLQARTRAIEGTRAA